jgi:hypothetical protein
VFRRSDALLLEKMEPRNLSISSNSQGANTLHSLSTQERFHKTMQKLNPGWSCDVVLFAQNGSRNLYAQFARAARYRDLWNKPNSFHSLMVRFTILFVRRNSRRCSPIKSKMLHQYFYPCFSSSCLSSQGAEVEHHGGPPGAHRTIPLDILQQLSIVFVDKQQQRLLFRNRSHQASESICL